MFGRDNVTFGQKGFWGTLYKMRLLAGLIAASPFLVLCVWYSGAAALTHYRYNLAAKASVPLTMELFHLHLYDHLRKDLRRLGMDSRHQKSGLPSVDLLMNNADLDLIESGMADRKDTAPYFKALVEADGAMMKAQVRLRGGKHWNWLNPQKSLKLKLDKTAYYKGSGSLSLKNEPDPISFGEQVILDIAREAGLLTPYYAPVEVKLNKAYMGVFFLETQPDEGLLRTNRRYPGKLYSGNDAPEDPDTGLCNLWTSTEAWKLASVKADEAADDLGEMKALQGALKQPQTRLAAFAEEHVDLEKYAIFDALDVVFGGNQHDYRQDQKLYFDPYKGRFEPISWNFRGWRHEEEINRMENPFLLGMKSVPGFVTLRNRKVYELVQGPCSVDGLSQRFSELETLLGPSLAHDPYWDAYRLLPPISNYHSQMLRPMDERRQELAASGMLAVQGERNRWLAETISQTKVTVSAWRISVPDGKAGTAVLLDLSGEAGIELSSLLLALNEPGCSCASMELLADSNGDGLLDPGDQPVSISRTSGFSLSKVLYPGVKLEARTRPGPERGKVRSAASTRRYPFILKTCDCSPANVTVGYRNLVSGAAAEQRVDVSMTPAAGPFFVCDDSPFTLEPGAESLHPWCYPPAQDQPVALGPGTLKMEGTRRFNGPVSIAPGTTLQMGPGAELHFHGPLRIEGRKDAKVVFESAGGCWGGLVIQGQKTSGSRLAWVEVRGACGPRTSLTSFPAAVNIHDTSDIDVRNLTLTGSAGKDDGLHVAYVDGFQIAESVFSATGADAMDIEFSRGTVSRVNVLGAGDECLDFMGSEVRVEKSLLLGAGGNGISAGEESRITVETSLISHAKVGVLSKNASKVTLSDSVLHKNRTGARLEQESPRYRGKPALRSGKLWVIGEGKDYVKRGGGKIKVERTETRLQEGELPGLRALLGIDAWSGLDERIGQLLKERTDGQDTL